jgi:hypothetical protein
MILASMQLFDRETWRFVNSFAPWLAALGTFTAALTALYLARRHARIRLRITASVETESDAPGKYVSCAVMKVVNDGPRDVTITEAYWELNGDKGFDGNLTCNSVVLPVRLRDGETVTFRGEDLNNYLMFLGGALVPVGLRVKACARTSTGRVFGEWLPKFPFQEANEAIESSE